MERHPLIFLGVVVIIAALNFLTLMYVALLHARLPQVTELLTGLRQDIAGLIDLEETNRRGDR